MSKIIAIPYYIDGPRSLQDAARTFNSLDKSDKIFSHRKGMGSFIKSVIGKDFSMKQLCERQGFMVEAQDVEFNHKAKSIAMHVKITEKGCNTSVNAILIVLVGSELMIPERLISIHPLQAESPTYLNIEIGFNKLSESARNRLGI